MKRRLLILTLLVMLVVAAPVVAQDRKVITVSYTQEPLTLSWIYITQWFAANVQDMLLSPPWYMDNNGQPFPVQVTEIPTVENGGVSADGTVITMHLRQDMVWSDGEPITSADYLFTYEMILAPGNAVASTYPFDSQVASVTAPDEYTVVITYNEPFAPWLTSGLLIAYPEHALRPIYEAEGTLDTAEWNRTINPGSGPFVLGEWETGSFLSLVRNDSYFAGPAKVDEVFFRIVADDGTSQNAALEVGDADIGVFLTPSDAVALEEIGMVIDLVPSGYNEAWMFNLREGLTHPAMLDANVRRALILAFNRQKIVDDLLLGTTRVPASFWDGTPYARPDAQPFPYDPEEAARLLDEAGWVDSNGDGTRDKDGVELVLRYSTTTRQIRRDVQAIVQQDLGALGVGIEIFNYENFFDTYAEGGPAAIGDYDIMEFSNASAFPDPDTLDFLCSEIPSDENPEGSNWTGLCDPELDALFEAQLRETDTVARIDIYHQIDQKMEEALVWAGIWYDADYWATNARVVDTLYSGGDPFWNAVNWDVPG
jgi:peptide/nickel transport system substrate-binding protein